MNPIEITILDHKNPEVAEQIWAVQSVAYRQEAALLGVDWFPPLDQTVTDILGSTDRFLGARVEQVLVGVASLESSDSQTPACISSMTVAPEFQRRGVARALMSAVLKEIGAEALTVSTGARNEPALALYAQFGFVVVKSRRVDELDLDLVELQRDACAAL